MLKNIKKLLASELFCKKIEKLYGNKSSKILRCLSEETTDSLDFVDNFIRESSMVLDLNAQSIKKSFLDNGGQEVLAAANLQIERKEFYTEWVGAYHNIPEYHAQWN